MTWLSKAARTRRRYERWERSAARLLRQDYGDAIADQFLSCPIPYSQARIEAQRGLLNAIAVGLATGSADCAVAAFDAACERFEAQYGPTPEEAP